MQISNALQGRFFLLQVGIYLEDFFGIAVQSASLSEQVILYKRPTYLFASVLQSMPVGSIKEVVIFLIEVYVKVAFPALR